MLNTETRGKLILLPNFLEPKDRLDRWLAPAVTHSMKTISGLFAESEKEGRRYLGYFFDAKEKRAIPIAPLLKQYSKSELEFYLEPVCRGESWGIVSDCGAPMIADPSQALVEAARFKNIPIELHSFISAPIFALALAAFPTNRFSFEGYLPIDPVQRINRIIALEKRSRDEKMVHIFIEAPHRSEALMHVLIETLAIKTRFALFWELCGKDEGGRVHTIADWRKQTLPHIRKKRAVFLFFS